MAKMKTSVKELVRPCYECKGPALGKKENYNYLECGLNNVVLKGVLVYRCERCGAENVEIPNMEGLHRSIALSILCKKSLLASDEIKFLRTIVGLTATELGRNLGVTKIAVSRWENGARIGMQSDRSIRVTCGLLLISQIINDPPVNVSAERVQETLSKLKEFVSSFNARDILSQHSE